MSRRSSRERRRARLRSYLQREIRRVFALVNAATFPPGMNMDFVAAFCRWEDLTDKLKKVPR